MPEQTSPVRVSRGLYGVAVAETSIAKSESDGTLTYRGYGISDIFENSTFEEAAFLILNGKLPSRQELQTFSSQLKKRSEVPHSVYDLVSKLNHEAHPMDVLRTAVSSLGAVELGLSPKDQQISVIAKIPVLVANCYRISSGKEPIKPDSSLNTAENLLYIIAGKRPTQFEARALERELILYLEHDLNASAFTVRVIASTLADVYAACTGGVAALKGPLHGGANEAAIEMLLKMDTPQQGVAMVLEMLSKGEKVMGFGHRVYKEFDPRARLSKELLKQLIAEKGTSSNLYDVAVAVEKKMWEMKKLPANLDFYAAPVFYVLGIPVKTYTPLFAASRVVGWVSHFNEQVAENKLIRPDAIYVGPSGLKYIPIDQR
jgi:citrate synthase